MTRYTSLGRKRTYLQAGFNNETDERNVAEGSSAPAFNATESASPNKDGEEHKKKKRKRSKSKKKKQDGENGGAENDEKEEGSSGSLQINEDAKAGGHDVKTGEGNTVSGWKRDKSISHHAAASEKRRLKRISEKYQNTTCFACREKGHAAKDCPKTLEETNVALDADDDAEVEENEFASKAGKKAKAVKATVGICYRCGSARHTLSRCRKPENSNNPLPFASCFVCSRTGHLASSCPKNASRGVYPNGGACILCGEKTHLAKNCPLRKEAQTPSAILLSSIPQTSTAAPTADEDDFHTFKRVDAEVDREEKRESRAKKRESAFVGVGAVSKKVVRIGAQAAVTGGQAKAKKVVFF